MGDCEDMGQANDQAIACGCVIMTLGLIAILSVPAAVAFALLWWFK